MPALCVGLTYLVLQAVRGPQDVDLLSPRFFALYASCYNRNDNK